MLIHGLQPTKKSSQEVLADFQNISNSTSLGGLAILLKNDFAEEGRELEAVATPPLDYSDSPPFLENVLTPLVKAFAQDVHRFWLQLLRTTNASALCSDHCESTFIPLNHTSVLPGLCFDHQYTLTKTKLTTIITRWKFQRTILLGQFLDRRGSSSIPAVLGRERNSSKLYG
jgi:hypothetical protein